MTVTPMMLADQAETMPPRQRRTLERLEDALWLHEHGVPVDEIADRVGMRHETLLATARRHGVLFDSTMQARTRALLARLIEQRAVIDPEGLPTWRDRHVLSEVMRAEVRAGRYTYHRRHSRASFYTPTSPTGLGGAS